MELQNELQPFGFSDLEGAVNSAAEANRLLYVIRKLEEEKDIIHTEWTDVLTETSTFYQNRMMQKQKSIDFLFSKIEAYVRATEKNLSLPNGKAIVKEITEVEWLADDEALVEYAVVNQIDNGIRTTIKPDKNVIKQWIGEGESSVLKRTPVKKFYIQLPKDAEQE